MELKKIVVHELIKESESKDVETIFSDELISINQNSTTFITSLLKAYNSDKILNAIFDDSPGRYFPEKFFLYTQSNRQDSDFISFSIEVLGNLKPIISPINFATGGYFVFTEYENAGRNFVSVFLIRDVEGKILSKTEHSYTINTIEYVDTKNLAMACRINENRIGEDGANYLSFTQVKQQVVSEYFKAWISIKQVESNKDYTNSLYSIISKLEPPVDEETGVIMDVQEVRNRVYSIAKDSPTQTINIRNIGEIIYGDEYAISNYAIENDLIIDTEFRFNNTALKKFIKLEVNRDGINLKISRGEVNKKVKISPDDENMVIIESPSFAKAFRNQTNLGNDN